MSRNAQTSLRLPEQRDVGAPRQASRAPTGRQPARRVVLGALVISTISLAALPAGALAAKDDLVLASRASGPAGVGGDAGSQPGLISADGRFATFSSPANNLSGEDTDGTADVFVRDLRFNTLTLVSRASGPAGAAGDGGSFNPSISADGRFVAFASFAKNLSGEDRDGVEDVFVRDLVAGTTTLVSRADGPAGAVGDGSSLLPSISADGHLVAFETFASNFSAEDRNRVEDVFVRDVVAGATTLVSRAIGPGGAPGDHGSSDPSISADGRLVTFSSAADNLVGDDTKATQDVFLRDLQTNRITLVTRPATAAPATRRSPTDGSSHSRRSPTTSAERTPPGRRMSSSVTCRPTPPPSSAARAGRRARRVTPAPSRRRSQPAGASSPSSRAPTISAQRTPTGRGTPSCATCRPAPSYS